MVEVADAVTDRRRSGAWSQVDLERLYHLHHRLVFGAVRSARIPPSAVEDVVQDVFIAVYRRRGRCPAEAHEIRAWLLGVTDSVCSAHRRSAERRRLRLLRAGEPEREAFTPEAVMGRREQVESLYRALGQLSDRVRHVYILVELEDVPVVEAARTLGLKLNTAYSRLRLARKALGESLGRAIAVDELRDCAGPSPSQRQRMWVAISAHAVSWVPSYGLVALGVAVVFATSGVVSLAVRATPEARASIAVHRAAPRRTPAPQERPASEPPEPARVAAVGPIQRKALGPAPRAAPEVSPLERESNLLRAAARELNTGDLKRAESLLAEHARRFPDGQLGGERNRLEIESTRLRAGRDSTTEH